MRRQNLVRVCRSIDVQYGVHRLMGASRSCITDQRSVVTEFRSESRCRLEASVGYEANADDLLLTVTLEQMVEIRVGEPA